MRWRNTETDPPRHQRPVLVWDGDETFPGFAVADYSEYNGWQVNLEFLQAENHAGGCHISLDARPAWWQDIPEFEFGVKEKNMIKTVEVVRHAGDPEVEILKKSLSNSIATFVRGLKGPFFVLGGSFLLNLDGSVTYTFKLIRNLPQFEEEDMKNDQTKEEPIPSVFYTCELLNRLTSAYISGEFEISEEFEQAVNEEAKRLIEHSF